MDKFILPLLSKWRLAFFLLGVGAALAAWVEFNLFHTTHTAIVFLSHPDPEFAMWGALVFLLGFLVTRLLPNRKSRLLDLVGLASERGLSATAYTVAGFGVGPLLTGNWLQVGQITIAVTWFSSVAYIVRQLRLKGAPNGWYAIAASLAFGISWAPHLHF